MDKRAGMTGTATISGPQRLGRRTATAEATTNGHDTAREAGQVMRIAPSTDPKGNDICSGVQPCQTLTKHGTSWWLDHQVIQSLCGADGTIPEDAGPWGRKLLWTLANSCRNPGILRRVRRTLPYRQPPLGRTPLWSGIREPSCMRQEDGEWQRCKLGMIGNGKELGSRQTAYRKHCFCSSVWARNERMRRVVTTRAPLNGASPYSDHA